MDTQLVEKIVHEVKSQGVFDEFRKDSISDVDTKPAYQNLRQRVENTVKKFLSEQKWSLETNKNQLREKLRRHITESGFLDVGVERIVDQVVNPKIGSVFQPRIEEIAYKYLGLQPPPKKFEQPPPPLMHPFPPLPLNAPPLKVETSSLLPTDLEQVSPDSDKATVKSEGKDEKIDFDIDNEEKLIEDEDESPPFEPLIKYETQEATDDTNDRNRKDNIIKDESNDDVIKTDIMTHNNESLEASNFATECTDLEKEASQSVDARISQDSQLSCVSSDSHMSRNAKEESLPSSSQEAVAANISEEAQMPKFNESSCELNITNGRTYEKIALNSDLHFDIKKDEIKFEGTERKKGLETLETTVVKSEEERYLTAEEIIALENKNESFDFTANNMNTKVKEEEGERTPNAQELSFGSSIEDSTSMPSRQTTKISTQKTEKGESPQIHTPKLTRHPASLTTAPILMPTTTPSPIAPQKIERDYHNRNSSSSSKHKKHSKERRRSYEREKEKDGKERHRSGRDTKDSSKYHSSHGTKSSSKHYSSSSSSKYSFSHRRSTEKDLEKSSSSSGHSSSKHIKHSHSHSSSSSIENQESRRVKRETSKRHSSSSFSKRSEKRDDHAEAKQKIQRRKSTDSNDDDDGDKVMGGGKYGYQYKSNTSSYGPRSSKSGGNENYRSSNYKTNECQNDQMEMKDCNEETYKKLQYFHNVVILNDILENPQTQFIQLNNKGHLIEMPVPQQTLKNEKEANKFLPTEFNNNIEMHLFEKEHDIEEKEESAKDLLYFEDIQLNISERVRLLNATMDLCRSAVNSLRFDSLSDEGIELSNGENVNIDKIHLLETLKRKSDINYEEFVTTPRKRFISNDYEDCQSKTSPSLSDTSSVNSKENEEFYKNTNYAKGSLLDRHKAVQKLSQQQRYSSEDLYKPRPILGQRSRRRGMNSLV